MTKQIKTWQERPKESQTDAWIPLGWGCAKPTNKNE